MEEDDLATAIKLSKYIHVNKVTKVSSQRTQKKHLCSQIKRLPTQQATREKGTRKKGRSTNCIGIVKALNTSNLSWKQENGMSYASLLQEPEVVTERW